MVKKIGLIGLTEGNGHPYSWGAIINGYEEEFLKKSNWDVIYQYVKKRDVSEFGFENFKITHIWTQSKEVSINLMKSIKAEVVVENYIDMLNHIDALIIARDDFENHFEMAKPFLEAGKKVFIDKPLTLDLNELLYFKPFLQSGQLMSVAGLRFAKELDDVRTNIAEFGTVKIIQSSVVVNWEKYGIHLIDGVLSVIKCLPSTIKYTSGEIDLFTVKFENGLIWTISILGSAPKTFNIQIWGENKKINIEIEDNFTMFRRMLYRYVKLVTNNEQLYNGRNTLISVGLLIAGNISKNENREVRLSEIYSVLEIEE